MDAAERTYGRNVREKKQGTKREPPSRPASGKSQIAADAGQRTASLYVEAVVHFFVSA